MKDGNLNLSNLDALDLRVETLLNQLTLKEKAALLSGQDVWNTVPIQRLGLPSITMTDGPHGVRAPREAGRKSGPTTAFPTGVSMASSWNPALVEQVGRALGEEARGMGCNILLGPCVNIVRHPLAGRNFESYSEDPYLAGRIGVSWVKGTQSQGVGASLKHYACNNQEIERSRGSSEIDERTLREIYLPQFEAIVKEAQPWTVMCSYNRINGIYASENHHLLTEILRNEWGFQGAVISDWGANHTITSSVASGLDLEMPGPAKYYGRLLEEAVANWQIDEAAIDQAVRRVLRLIAISGKLDGTWMPDGAVNTPEHQSLARQLAEEAITLLKNEGNLLPMEPGQVKSIAVIGPNAADLQVSGGGSSYVEPPYCLSPLEQLQASLEGQVKVSYEQGCDNYIVPPTLSVDYLTLPSGTGHGLAVEFYDNADLEGQPVLKRADQKLDYWWFENGPVENLPIEAFSARWNGQLTVPESGNYTIRVTNSDRCRLYLDDQLRLEHSRKGPLGWENPTLTSTAQVALSGQQPHALRIEFQKSGEESFARFQVSLARNYQPGEDQRIARAAELAARCDLAVIFVGMPEFYESEGHDRPDMNLPGPQDELIQAVVAANPRTIVVLNAGSPVSMPWIDQVPAVLDAYYPGLEGGKAITNVLLGEVNPSGKLSVTYPRRLEDTPAFTNYPGTREVRYGEGIFVGYRHYDARGIEPLFPFGHGLSYTTFEYGPLQVSQPVGPGEPVRVSVAVRNNGKSAGKEVVQLYLQDKQASLPRPPKELKGFIKIELGPGETRTVNFDLDQRALSFFDPYQNQWICEAGEFEILIGSSSRDIRCQETFNLA